ncbi:MAG: ATP phosphoribosyltransferase regulatory subunit [Oscillospiraceae bacterium]|nr:ATP phosphoribosyltransferase regulatory subunit [Oscillospiraceae bacterium]
MNSLDRIIKSDERAIFELRALYKSFGYSQYKMSRFEEYDLYVRNKDFLLSDEVITFTDRNGRLLALKPDVTLSIIKNSSDEKGLVEKLYYNENVYRVAPGTHNFKEIMQAGLECIGDLSFYDISEVVLLAAKSLSLISESYVLDISHMGLIAAVLEDAGLSPQGKKQALTFLNQKNPHELLSLCEAEGIDKEKSEKIAALAEISGTTEEILSKLKEILTSEGEIKAFAEFRTLFEIINEAGFGDNVRIDFSVGNNMKYYSGVVFNGYVEGIPTSVLSGGQYDKLLAKMKKGSSAIGFAIYLDLLERFEDECLGYDIDTVLLNDGSTDPIILSEIANKLHSEGGVLVTSAIPKNIKYRRLMEIKEGVVTILNEND